MSAREQILGRLRAALGDAPPEVSIPREYRRTSTGDAPTLADQITDRITDYRATVYRARPDDIASVVGGVLRAAGTARLVVPPDLPAEWLAEYPGSVLRDAVEGLLDPPTLDAADAVLTGCAVAIAETGTLVLDGGANQGRRVLTLVPDHHICVVHADQIVGGVPEALARLRPSRPLTFISGPSATSDIELRRVEGVHGPRRLDVVLVELTAR